jgi:hypothetical protein
VITAPKPQLPAYPRDDGLTGLRVWCTWCDRWHYHGPGYGHRAAHCYRRGSPYRDTGYVLTRPDAQHGASTGGERP